jgi:predicted RNA-binding Zn ribbon-like protein
MFLDTTGCEFVEQLAKGAPTKEPALVRLANLGHECRPADERNRLTGPPLTAVVGAASLLAGLVEADIAVADLPGLRKLNHFAQRFVQSALTGSPLPDLTELNTLAGRSRGHPRLVAAVGGGWQRRMIWEPTSAAIHLARTVIDELATLDRSRFKECATPDCPMVFYDNTRSRTRRWHNETCGWRTRQARHHRRP